jgi:uncharacterized protein
LFNVIGRGSRRFAPVLLRRHVRRRAEQRPGGGEGHVDAQRRLGAGRLARRGGGGDADQPEIGDPQVAVGGDQHVLGLEVAMDQPGAMRRGEAAPGAHESIPDLAPRPRFGAAPRAQGPPGAVLHRDEHLIAIGAHLVDDDDVRVRQPRHRARLAQQALAPLRGGDAGQAQQLERHLAIQIRIVGGQHDPHSALAERLEHHEPPDPATGRVRRVIRLRKADGVLGRRRRCRGAVGVDPWVVVNHDGGSSPGSRSYTSAERGGSRGVAARAAAPTARVDAVARGRGRSGRGPSSSAVAEHLRLLVLPSTVEAQTKTSITRGATMDPVVHFEMPYEDRDRAATFYETVFGWKTEKLGAEMGDYMVVTTADKDATAGAPGGAIGGGFFPKRPDSPQHPSVVIGVEDIRRSIGKVIEAGGKVLGDPMAIPGIGQYVAFLDTEGNQVSMLQPETTP